MAKTRFAPDRGLTARMVITMVLLLVLYLVLAGALWLLFGESGSVLIWAGLPMLMLWGQWWYSDKLALAGMRAREVTPAEAPQLHAMVDRLCALADMPKPRVAIAVTDMPNAFATGRNPDNAVVCVTTGIMKRLDERELEAVLAHELAHVGHRDVTVMTIASTVGVLAGVLMRSVAWSSMGRSRDNSAAAFLVVALVGIVVYAVSFLLTRLLSRYRELSADRAGAILIGQPATLASALVKISGDMTRVPQKDLRAAEPYNAFFVVPAFMHGRRDLGALFSTHPPLEQRLDQLARLSAELGRPTG
jgi:heat shock protein HtpX